MKWLPVKGVRWCLFVWWLCSSGKRCLVDDGGGEGPRNALDYNPSLTWALGWALVVKMVDSWNWLSRLDVELEGGWRRALGCKGARE